MMKLKSAQGKDILEVNEAEALSKSLFYTAPSSSLGVSFPTETSSDHPCGI